jgi:hypothetical protein
MLALRCVAVRRVGRGAEQCLSLSVSGALVCVCVAAAAVGWLVSALPILIPGPGYRLT